MDRKKAAGYVKNLTTYFGASLIPMILNLVTNPWIAKNMSPTDYAISGYYTSYTTLITPIITFYLVHFYIKEYFRADENKRLNLFATIAKALIWFSGIVSLVCFIAILLYLRYIHSDFSLPISPYLALVVFACPLAGLVKLQLAQYRMEKKATAFFRLSMLHGLLTIVLSFVLVVFLKLGALGKLLGPFLTALAIFLYMLYRYKDILKIKTSFSDFKRIFVFCLPLALSAMLGYFTDGFSTTYMENIGNTNEYGVYIVGLSLGGYLSVFGTAVGNTFQPDIYEAVIKRQWKRYVRVISIEVGFMVIVVLTFIVLAPYVIDILTAGRYVDATPYARVISLSTLTSNIYYLINQFSIAKDRPRLYLYTSILGSVAIVCLIPWMVGEWGLMGGAWLNVFSFIIFSIINLALLAFKRRS